MEIKQAQSLKEIDQAHSDHNLVVYVGTDGTKFVLNPFGGGTVSTEEIALADGWEVTEDKLERIFIIS